VLEAHARDELGMFAHTRARPVQAAVASAGAFTAGAAMPILLAFAAPVDILQWVIGPATLVLLFGLGALAAKLGGGNPGLGALRVAFWGAMAMAATALVGSWFGTVV
jgi:VIT1/CCC1 family predicted Fe2+/Mn2+ transporter